MPSTHFTPGVGVEALACQLSSGLVWISPTPAGQPSTSLPPELETDSLPGGRRVVVEVQVRPGHRHSGVRNGQPARGGQSGGRGSGNTRASAFGGQGLGSSPDQSSCLPPELATDSLPGGAEWWWRSR